MSSHLKYYTQKELKKLFRAIEKEKDYPYWLRDLTMFHFGYFFGLRVSEVRLFCLEYYNENSESFYCRRLKNSISNTLFLDETRKRIFKKYVREYGIKDLYTPLFQSKKKNPISARQLDRLMRYYASIANLPKEKAHWHTLKHSIAVHLRESEADLRDVQEYLGHKDVKSTEIYAHFTSNQRKAFYHKIHKNYQIVT